MPNIPSNTVRLRFRQAELGDAAFMQQLLTEPSWEKFIGRSGVQSLDDAQVYLTEKFIPAYVDGLGFWLVELRETGRPIGICGLVQRPFLEHVDLGFAFLESSWGGGYASEASRAVVAYARDDLKRQRLWAITLASNAASIKLLTRLGFLYLNDIAKPNGETVAVYENDLSRAAAV